MNRDSLVICPVYNQENKIDEFYRLLRKSYKGDVFFVDDGSIDKSRDFLCGIKSKNNFLIQHPQKNGYTAALATGFKFALDNKYKKVATIDVDLQYKPEYILNFLRELDRQEVVLGSRYLRIINYTDVPMSSFTINRYLSELIKQLYSIEFTDAFCMLRAYRNSFLRKLRLREKHYGGCLEILLEIIRTKASFREVPVEINYLKDESKLSDDLDDPRKRLLYYLEVIRKKIKDIPYK